MVELCRGQLVISPTLMTSNNREKVLLRGRDDRGRMEKSAISRSVNLTPAPCTATEKRTIMNTWRTSGFFLGRDGIR